MNEFERCQHLSVCFSLEASARPQTWRDIWKPALLMPFSCLERVINRCGPSVQHFLSGNPIRKLDHESKSMRTGLWNCSCQCPTREATGFTPRVSCHASQAPEKRKETAGRCNREGKRNIKNFVKHPHEEGMRSCSTAMATKDGSRTSAQKFEAKDLRWNHGGSVFKTRCQHTTVR